ncbi:MAG: hypothetical protein QOI74_789, partial [Micromonosporaceae bacterium]|nr:hypothetical protein [Micromonosporaceae bacterium]
MSLLVRPEDEAGAVERFRPFVPPDVRATQLCLRGGDGLLRDGPGGQAVDRPADVQAGPDGG